MKQMVEVLEFIFSSFWVWLGTFCLLMPICSAVGGIVASVVGRRKS